MDLSQRDLLYTCVTTKALYRNFPKPPCLGNFTILDVLFLDGEYVKPKTNNIVFVIPTDHKSILSISKRLHFFADCNFTVVLTPRRCEQLEKLITVPASFYYLPELSVFSVTDQVKSLNYTFEECLSLNNGNRQLNTNFNAVIDHISSNYENVIVKDTNWLSSLLCPMTYYGYLCKYFPDQYQKCIAKDDKISPYICFLNPNDATIVVGSLLRKINKSKALLRSCVEIKDLVCSVEEILHYPLSVLEFHIEQLNKIAEHHTKESKEYDLDNSIISKTNYSTVEEYIAKILTKGRNHKRLFRILSLLHLHKYQLLYRKYRQQILDKFEFSCLKLLDEMESVGLLPSDKKLKKSIEPKIDRNVKTLVVIRGIVTWEDISSLLKGNDNVIILAAGVGYF